MYVVHVHTHSSCAHCRNILWGLKRSLAAQPGSFTHFPQFVCVFVCTWVAAFTSGEVVS